MQGDGAKAALWQPGQRLRRCRYHRCAAILLGYMLRRGRGVHGVWLWEYTPFRAVFAIYRYLSGIYHFLINFSSGMVCGI